MRPDIHAGSTIANAIAHNANATSHTMLANSEILGRNLSNIFETMNRNRALREQEEQRKLDNAYRENAFNYQKVADERNYNYQKERDLAKDNQWAQEIGLKRQQVAQGWGHADLYKQQAEALRFQNERNRQLYSDDYMPIPPDTTPTPQPQVFLTREEALKQAPQQPSFLAQHRTQQDNGIPKMVAAVINKKGQIEQPQIVMRSKNPKDKAMEAELNKRLQERKAYLQTLRNER